MRALIKRDWLLSFAIACAPMVAFEVSLAQDGKSSTPDKKQSSFGEESKNAPKIDDKKFDIPYWDRSESFQIRAAIALIGEGDPFGVLAARMAISENVPTVLGWEFFFDRALPLNRSYLDAIRDGRPLPDVRAKEIRDLRVADQGLYLAYLQALRRSHAATTEMFQNSAPAFEHVTYTHLAADPKLYRGEIITVKGKLAAMNTIQAPPLVQIDGILTIYEGWIIGPKKGMPPIAVVVTQLPKDWKLNAEVAFQGYFLSNILIPADKERGNTKKDLICPWLIGKTLIVTEDKLGGSNPVIESSRSYEVALYTFGAILGVSALIALLNWYFRRTDEGTKAKLAALREKHQPFSLENGDADEKKPADKDNPDGDWPSRIGK